MNFFEPKITNLTLQGFENKQDKKPISIVGITNQENTTQLQFNFQAIYINPNGKYILKIRILNRDIEIHRDQIKLEVNLDDSETDKRITEDYFATGLSLTARQIAFSEGPHKVIVTLCDLDDNVLDEKDVYFYVRLNE